jgi:hypothetical protein
MKFYIFTENLCEAFFSEHVIMFALHFLSKICTILILVFINYRIYLLLVLVISRNRIHMCDACSKAECYLQWMHPSGSGISLNNLQRKEYCIVASYCMCN